MVLAEISPQIELVQVLLYLTEQQDRTCQYLNNRAYVDSIKKRFLKFKNHNAVILTKQLVMKRSFYHIKPLRAILQLEDILTDVAAIDFITGEVLEGYLPNKAMSMVQEWVAIHKATLLEIWKTQEFKKIPPLE